MNHDVFISYSSKDEQFADELRSALEKTGVSCWQDKQSIGAGANWQAEITRALKNTQIMVLIFSSNSIQSGNVGKELSLASKYQRLIIPIRVEDVEFPDDWDYNLAGTNCLEVFKRQQTVDEIAEQIRKEVGSHRTSRPAETGVAENGEQRYRTRFRKYLQDDGVIEDKERELLLDLCGDLGIDEARARQIEEEERKSLSSTASPSPRLAHAPSAIDVASQAPAPETKQTAVSGIEDRARPVADDMMLVSDRVTGAASKLVEAFPPVGKIFLRRFLGEVPGLRFTTTRNAIHVLVRNEYSYDYQVSLLPTAPDEMRVCFEFPYATEGSGVARPGWNDVLEQRLLACGCGSVSRQVPGTQWECLNVPVTSATPADAVGKLLEFVRWYVFIAFSEDGSEKIMLPPKAAEFVATLPAFASGFIGSLPPNSGTKKMSFEKVLYLRVASGVDDERSLSIGSRGDGIYVAFGADENEMLGRTGLTFWSKLESERCPQPQKTMPERTSAGEGGCINCTLRADTPTEGCEALLRYSRWFLLEAPYYEE